MKTRTFTESLIIKNLTNSASNTPQGCTSNPHNNAGKHYRREQEKAGTASELSWQESQVPAVSTLLTSKKCHEQKACKLKFCQNIVSSQQGTETFT